MENRRKRRRDATITIQRFVRRRRAKRSVVRRTGRRTGRGSRANYSSGRRGIRFGRTQKGKVSRKPGVSGRIGKWLWDRVCTPLIIKKTDATYKLGDGPGVRSYYSVPLYTRQDLTAACAMRPVTFINSSGTVQSMADRMKVDLCTKKFTIQNRANCNMHLKIYECIVRKDTSSTNIPPDDSGILQLFRTSTYQGSDNTAMNRGPTQGSYLGGTDALTEVHQNPTYTPYMSSKFCSFFKILKCHNHAIGPNQYITKKFSQKTKMFSPWKMDNAEGYTKADATTAYRAQLEWIGGWSKLLLFTWVGQIVDTGNLSDNKISRSNNPISLIVDTDFHFHFEPGNIHKYRIESSNTAPISQWPLNNRYKTSTADTYVAPAVMVCETVAAEDDTVIELGT